MKNFILNHYKSILLLFITFSFATSCYEDLDDNISPVSVELEIKDFVYKALNAYYLYKDEIPDLANDRFSNDEEYNSYLESFNSPEALFESLIYMRETVDRFSVIYDDYIEAEQQSAGVSKRTGIRFALVPDPQDANRIHLLILEIAKDSPADDAGLNRGMFVATINGSQITIDNYRSLLEGDSFTLGFGDYDDNGTDDTSDDTMTPTDESVTLTRVIYTDKAVNYVDVLEIDGQNVGYLVYNRFNVNFEAELNSAFALFKDSNVQNLILDLRYNPGGQIITASRLASMITGQFNGEVFSQLVYNSDLQEFNSNYLFTDQIQGGQAINSLNLDKVYVLTTGSSASASELVINSLSPYINVVQIGTTTVGKTQASLLLYDSPNFSAENRNPRHTYALQPLIANSVDRNGNAVPGTGLVPDIQLMEIPDDYQILDFGDVNERLLAAALADIRGSSRVRNNSDGIHLDTDYDGLRYDGGLIIEKDKAPSINSGLNQR